MISGTNKVVSLLWGTGYWWMLPVFKPTELRSDFLGGWQKMSSLWGLSGNNTGSLIRDHRGWRARKINHGEGLVRRKINTCTNMSIFAVQHHCGHHVEFVDIMVRIYWGPNPMFLVLYIQKCPITLMAWYMHFAAK